MYYLDKIQSVNFSGFSSSAYIDKLVAFQRLQPFCSHILRMSFYWSVVYTEIFKVSVFVQFGENAQ